MKHLGTHRTLGYAAAVAIPVALTALVTWLRLPPFVFEHLIVLLVVGIAIPWGLGPAVVCALVAVTADDVLLREPVGQPGITGVRDIIDLALFAAVAVVVSGLVTWAHTERIAAREAAERERRAREDRDRLIATVSHDLATPLAVLGASVQFAQRFGSGAEQDFKRLLQRLETATARATSLVKSLTDAQAIDSEELVMDLAVVDLRELVARTAQMLDRMSERHPVVLAAPHTPVMVRADADRLNRVVENLVNNAIKYSPSGGTVEVLVSVEGGQAVVRVRDRGIGISPDALPHIFDRSYRAPEAAAAAPGLGLGLTIAAHVVAKHDGTLQAQAADGGGTIVSLRLPLAAQAAAPLAGVGPAREDASV
jgi:signal transduction histidine kinase